MDWAQPSAQGLERGPDFGRVAVVSGLVTFLLLQLLASYHAGWVFEYPLDDPYIHLAMASQIAHGGYGVNAGEYASAASSPLYPFLLTAFPDTGFQRFLPLIWNIVGLVISMWLWGRALVWAGYRGWQGWVLALTVPVFSGAISIAYTGMEHALHAAATIAIVFGLTRFLIERRLGAMLFLGLFFSPLMRFEGLALGTTTILVLLAHRRFGAGALAALLVFVPVGVFVWFLVHLGLSPLPNSVQAKLVSHEDIGMPFLQRAIGTLLINFTKFGGLSISGLSATLMYVTVLTATQRSRILATVAWVLSIGAVAALSWAIQDLSTNGRLFGPGVGALLVGGLTLLLLLVQALRLDEDPSPLIWLALALSVAAAGHLVLAQVGWMNRYEHYLNVSLLLAIAMVAGLSGSWFRTTSILAILAMVAVGQYFLRLDFTTYSWASRAINAQQTQMARYAQDYLNRNVAVNDIGRVAWGNPNYVLDLWGLANDKARWIRLHDPEPGWAGPLVAAKDVSVIMIYDMWLEHAIDPSWVPLGKLILLNPRGYLGDIKVSFYARNPQEAAYAEAALREWKKTLVKDTCFIPMDVTHLTECPN